MPWRTENPNYQPADVAHNYNSDIGGAQGGGDSSSFLVAPINNVWWHGSASGDVGGGDRSDGLHIGDYQTAAEALNAHIGPNPHHPEGRWTGDHSLSESFPDLFDKNGDQILADADPERPKWNRYQMRHPDGTPMHGSYRPNVFPVAITGPMGNTTDTAVSDGQAHALMRRQRSRPPKTPKGYYYINGGEGTGVDPQHGIVWAASATVPSVDHITKLDPAEHEHIAEEAHQNWYEQKNNPNRSSYDDSKYEGLPPVERYQEIERQKREQERRALEWRNKYKRGY